MLARQVGAEGINGFETAIADITKALQTIQKDGVHRWRRAKDMIDLQIGHYLTDVGLRII